jgi:hypothetical protein
MNRLTDDALRTLSLEGEVWQMECRGLKLVLREQAGHVYDEHGAELECLVLYVPRHDHFEDHPTGFHVIRQCERSGETLKIWWEAKVHK